MLRPTAQSAAITPWSMLGGRGGRGGNGIAAIVVEARGREREGPKKFAEPVAVSSTAPVDFPLRPLRAASYGLSVLLRPTPAPCSAQEGMYGLQGHAARGRRDENAAICER
jgi:hypothetical protein